MRANLKFSMIILAFIMAVAPAPSLGEEPEFNVFSQPADKRLDGFWKTAAEGKTVYAHVGESDGACPICRTILLVSHNDKKTMSTAIYEANSTLIGAERFLILSRGIAVGGKLPPGSPALQETAPYSYLVIRYQFWEGQLTLWLPDCAIMAALVARTAREVSMKYDCAKSRLPSVKGKRDEINRFIITLEEKNELFPEKLNFHRAAFKP